jgi:hypothetical protein
MKTFEVKDIHIKLLQNAYVSWEGCEFGAPSIDCKRPYGNSYVYGDLAEFCGIERVGGDFTREQYDYMNQVHQETETVLQIFLKVGKMEPGKYQLSGYKDWVKVE